MVVRAVVSRVPSPEDVLAGELCLVAWGVVFCPRRRGVWRVVAGDGCAFPPAHPWLRPWGAGGGGAGCGVAQELWVLWQRCGVDHDLKYNGRTA